MPTVLGQNVTSVQEIVGLFRRHGDAVRGTYRARYVIEAGANEFYRQATLERPESMRDNPPNVVYPWEQILVAAADCAGSDYPMLAQYFDVAIERVEFVVEGLFDPRGEFDGLDGYEAPGDAAPCYLALHVRASLTSDAPRGVLERIHRRVVDRNMVFGALRGVPKTDELVIQSPAEVRAAG